MNYYKSLNNVISTIEENLTNEIQHKDLAKIVGTSSYTLQRIFAFLTGITLTEYIRKCLCSTSSTYSKEKWD